MADKFDRLLAGYNEHLQARGFSPRTVPEYIRNVERFLAYLKELNIYDITEVNQRIMAAYQVSLLEEKYRDRPISTVTKLRRLSTVRSFFQYLVKTGVVTFDPTADLDLPKRHKSLPKNILTKKEMAKLLSLPDLSTPLGIRDRAILETLYSTGIRASELCNLKLVDVDTARGELRVTKGKNAKDRVVPIGEIACDYIELYLAKARRFLAPASQPILFVTKSGKKFHYTTLSHLVIRYGKKAGLKKQISAHSLRHTCASHLLKGKADIRYIQEILGHASLATTQVYTKVEINDLKKVHHRCHPREKKEVPINDGWY